MSLARCFSSTRIRLLISFAAFCLSISPEDTLAQMPNLFVQQKLSYASSISISNDNRYVVTGDLDGVKLYDLQIRQQVRVLRHFAVDGVLFSPDGKLLASIGQDENASAYGVFHYSLKIWRVSDGALLHTLAHTSTITQNPSQFHGLAFSPSGTTLISAGEDHTIIFVDVASGTELRSFNVKGNLLSVDYSPDGALIVGVGYRGFARVWHADSGEVVRTLAHGDQNVTVARFSPDGRQIATGSADKQLRIWDRDRNTPPLVADVGNQISSLAFERTQRALLVAAGLTVTRWPFNIPDLQGALLQSYTSQVHAVAVSPDGTTAVSSADNELVVWNLGREKEAVHLGGSAQLISCMSLELDGKVLVADLSFGAQVWDHASGMLMCTMERNNRCLPGGLGSMSPNNELIAMIDFPSVEIQSAKTHSPVRQLSFESSNPVRIATFRPDSKKLATGSLTGTVAIWDLSSGQQETSIQTSPPARRLQVGGSPGFTVQDPATMWPSMVIQLAWSPDGHILAGVVSDVDQGLSVRLWNASDGQELRRLTVGNDFIGAMAFSHDGTMLVTGDDRGGIITWDVKSGKKLKVMSSDSDRITSFLFDTAPGFLFSASANGMIRLWDLESGRRILTLVATGQRDWLAVTDDGLFDGTPQAMKVVGWRLGNSNEVASIEAFYNDFFHPGLYYELRAGRRPKAQADIATFLQVPGLRTMLAQRVVTIRKDAYGARLCFPTPPASPPTLYRDAFPLAFDPGKLSGNPSDPECRFAYPLGGSAQYELVNALPPLSPTRSKSRTATTLLDVSHSRLHVQTIAIGGYSLTNNGFNSLPNSVLEAEEVKAFFSEQAKNDKRPFRSVKIWDALYDDSATRGAILSRLDAISEDLAAGDVLLLLLVGHGIVPAGQEMYYFVAKDTIGPDPHQLENTGISTAMLVQALRGMKSRQIVVVIDSCQSGGALEALAKIADLNTLPQSLNDAKDPATAVGLYVIATATPLEETVQKSGSGALITAFLLSLHGETGSHENVTVQQLLTATERRINEDRKSQPRVSSPMMIGVGSDYAIAARTN